MDVCRTCMTRNNLCPLFNNNFDSEQLFKITGVAIAPDDGLSQSICTMCISIIADALDLREISLNVDKKLRILAMKIKNTAKYDIDNTDHIDSSAKAANFDSTDDKDSFSTDICPTVYNNNKIESDSTENYNDENDSCEKIETIEFVIENSENEEANQDKNELSDCAKLSDITDKNDLTDIDRIIDECKSILSMNGIELASKWKEEKSKPPIISTINNKAKKYLSKQERIAKELNIQKYMSLAITPYDPKGPVQCKMCSSIIKNAIHFKNHAKTHFDPEYPCELCPRKFYTPTFLRYHKQRLHGDQKRLKCEHCPFRSVDKECLQNHVYAVHTGERPFVCELCNATFRRQIVLKQHMRIHSGVKNAQCEMCSSMFKSKSQLWKHRQLVHLTNITYHCYLCTTSSATSQSTKNPSAPNHCQMADCPECCQHCHVEWQCNVKVQKMCRCRFKRALPVKRHIEKVHGIPMDQQMEIKRVKTRKHPPNS